MRKWTVDEIERIESDIQLVSELIRDDFATTLRGPSSLLDSEADCMWLAERIETRALKGTNAFQRCDGCRNETAQIVRVVVNEYYDDMGAPSTLGVSYVCRYHVQYN